MCHRHAGDLRHYICSVVCCKKIESADWPLRHVVDGRFVLDRQVATSKIDM